MKEKECHQGHFWQRKSENYFQIPIFCFSFVMEISSGNPVPQRVAPIVKCYIPVDQFIGQ
jgi:hypothetical protein